MTPTYLHILVNNLPIFGSFLGSIVLTYGLVKKNDDTKVAAYLVLLIAAFGGYIAFISGKIAADSVVLIPDIAKNMISLHSDSATLSLTALILLGISSLIGLMVTVKKSAMTKNLAIISLLIALVCLGMTSWTGYLGGQIRHTEIKSPPVASHLVIPDLLTTTLIK